VLADERRGEDESCQRERDGGDGERRGVHRETRRAVTAHTAQDTPAPSARAPDPEMAHA
jgi:hypothetical protein